MDPQAFSSRQVYPQDTQQAVAPAPNYYQRTPDPVYYRTVPVGGALAETVASNDANPSFAQNFGAIDYIQHILASGRFQEYLSYTDPSTLKAVFERFHNETVAFVNEQEQALQGDRPYLEAYDNEVCDFEIKLKAVEAAVTTSTISTTEGIQAAIKKHNLANSVLLMMRSRSANMKQDCTIRKELLSVEHEITRHSASVIQLQYRIKIKMMNKIHDEGIMKGEFWKILNDILPLDHLRQQKRKELRQCRHLRAVLEKTLGEAKARLEASEPAFSQIKKEDV